MAKKKAGKSKAKSSKKQKAASSSSTSGGERTAKHSSGSGGSSTTNINNGQHRRGSKSNNNNTPHTRTGHHGTMDVKTGAHNGRAGPTNLQQVLYPRHLESGNRGHKDNHTVSDELLYNQKHPIHPDLMLEPSPQTHPSLFIHHAQVVSHGHLDIHDRVDSIHPSLVATSTTTATTSNITNTTMDHPNYDNLMITHTDETHHPSSCLLFNPSDHHRPQSPSPSPSPSSSSSPTVSPPPPTPSPEHTTLVAADIHHHDENEDSHIERLLRMHLEPDPQPITPELLLLEGNDADTDGSILPDSLLLSSCS